MKFINSGTKMFSIHLFAYQMTVSVILLILMPFITSTSPNSMLVKFNIFYQESSVLLADFINPFCLLNCTLNSGGQECTQQVWPLLSTKLQIMKKHRGIIRVLLGHMTNCL